MLRTRDRKTGLPRPVVRGSCSGSRLIRLRGDHRLIEKDRAPVRDAVARCGWSGRVDPVIRDAALKAVDSGDAPDSPWTGGTDLFDQLFAPEPDDRPRPARDPTPAGCHHLVHWGLPWSLIRVEQRNGRIDRHVQTGPPEFRAMVLTSAVTGALATGTSRRRSSPARRRCRRCSASLRRPPGRTTRTGWRPC